MPSPLAVESVNHLARIVEDVEKTKAFYRDVLGFREIRRPNFSFPGAWLFNYGLQIHLIRNEDEFTKRHDISTRAAHLAFHVDDIEAAEQTLNDHGIEYRKNYVPDTGVTQIFFHDPDGCHIELGTYPAVVELPGN